MRAFRVALGLVAAMTVASTARAELLVGLTTNSGITGVNVEVVGKGTSGYILLGAYPDDTGYEPENLTGMIGFRRFQGGKADQNGYFGGGFAGDVDGGPGYNRFGAGGELGYQWLTDHLRFTLHAGMALAGESSRGAREGQTDISPVPHLGASVSLRR
ncbi:MAG: hypothetical protein ACOY3X_06935 [Pseudomonadota bacterium]